MLCIYLLIYMHRSFGLTMLAVCWGRYPIDTTEDGYWGLVKSISDDVPPSPGPPFSDKLCSFVDACLKKDPNERLSAIQLLKLPFVITTVTTGNKVRIVNKTRRSSEGQVVLGKAIKTAAGALDEKTALDKQRSQVGLDDADDDVAVTHLHRILDQLESRALDLEEDEDEEFGEVSAGVEELTIRGSTYAEGNVEEAQSEAVNVARSKPSLVLPSLRGAGTNKWRHLANQLQLPLDVVLLAAKKRISERFLRQP
jgi:serine/threonine protein kinase